MHIILNEMSTLMYFLSLPVLLVMFLRGWLVPSWIVNDRIEQARHESPPTKINASMLQDTPLSVAIKGMDDWEVWFAERTNQQVVYPHAHLRPKQEPKKAKLVPPKPNIDMQSGSLNTMKSSVKVSGPINTYDDDYFKSIMSQVRTGILSAEEAKERLIRDEVKELPPKIEDSFTNYLERSYMTKHRETTLDVQRKLQQQRKSQHSAMNAYRVRK